MAEEASLSSSHMTDEDLQAIATYLKDEPGRSIGKPAPVAASDPAMPLFRWLLGDEQIAAVLTYIRNAWGNVAGSVTADAVQTAQSSLTSQDRWCRRPALVVIR